MHAPKIDRIPRISFERRKPNKLAILLHKQIRPKLNLERDYDPKTKEYLPQPDDQIPEYTLTEKVRLNIIADFLYDLPMVEDSEQ